MSGPAEYVARSAADDAACAQLVRAQDMDRYFSTLFAASGKRPALLALYAFNAEITQVRARISDPLPAAIRSRLRWSATSGTMPCRAMP
jgi:15-cis-phytoene synthase